MPKSQGKRPRLVRESQGKSGKMKPENPRTPCSKRALYGFPTPLGSENITLNIGRFWNKTDVTSEIVHANAITKSRTLSVKR